MLNREAEMNRAGLAAELNQRQSEEDAWSKLLKSSYIAGGGAQFKPTNISIRGQAADLPSFSFAPKNPSEEAIAGAKTLQQTMLQRLQPGSGFKPTFDYKPTPVSEYTQPGMAERVGQWGSVGLGAVGLLDSLGILGKIPGLRGVFGSGAGSTTAANTTGAATSAATGGSRIAGLLSKAAPYAGAAAGTYGLIKNKGLMSNLGSGALAGSSIGSMFGGPVGAGIGAGVGAGVGALRSAFNTGPNKEELAARDTTSDAISALITTATPQQRAEAATAGWENPDQALANIVLRDTYGPEKGGQLMAQLLAASRPRG